MLRYMYHVHASKCYSSPHIHTFAMKLIFDYVNLNVTYGCPITTYHKFRLDFIEIILDMIFSLIVIKQKNHTVGKILTCKGRENVETLFL